MSGVITRRVSCHALAPSTRAASMTSWGKLCSPASRMTRLKPTFFQTDTAMTAGSAVAGSPSQGWASAPSPIPRRKVFSSPVFSS